VNPPPASQAVGGTPIVLQVVAAEKHAAEPAKPAKKSGWERFIQVMPLVQALALAGVGFWLTGSVTNAIQQRQLELNNVKEMQSLMVKLYDREASPENLNATVAALTAFRDYAIPPLTNLLQSQEPNQRTAAESGLRALALSDSGAVAAQLLRVVGSRNRICSWRMLQSSIRLLGDLRCHEALPALRDLERRLSPADPAAAVQALSSITNPDAPADAGDIAELKSEIETAIGALQPAASGGPAR
jgi:hypothetical protein